MNEEIKEILDNLKIHNDYYKNQEHNYAFPDYYSLNYEDLDILLNYITNLQDENDMLKEENRSLRNNYNDNEQAIHKIMIENQKLNKIIDELEKWLKETKKFNYGFKIKSEYIYTYEFVCKNILNKLTKLKKEVE